MKLYMVALIVALAAFLTTTAIVFAQPAEQESVARFVILESEKSSYILSDNDEVKIQFEVEYSGGEEKITLEVEITVLDSTGNIVFESEDDYGEMIMTLRSGSSTTRSVTWQISDATETGTYTVTGILFESGKSKRNPFDERNEDDGITFEISEKPELRLSPSSLGTAVYEAGEIIEKIVRIKNSGGGILEWEVTEWPEWVQIVNRQSISTSDGQFILRVVEPLENAPLTFTRCCSIAGMYRALKSNLSGEVVISSNVGDTKFEVDIRFPGSSGTAHGEITKVRPVERRYRQGDVVEIEFVIENTGDIPMVYRGSLRILQIDSNKTYVAYDSNEEVEDQKISLQPGESEAFTLIWSTSFKEKTGDYDLEAVLRYWDDWDVIFDSVGLGEKGGFDINQAKKEPRLSISPLSIDLGTINQGDTLDASLTVENTALGTLEWSVDQVPDWIELISPSSTVSGPGEILFKVKDSAPAETLVGAIGITSNAGSVTVTVTLGVRALPTPTPSPLPPTQVPALATPTREPAATSIAPPPTRTPEPAQSVSTPTPPTPEPETTSTPTEAPVIPTAERTSTSVVAAIPAVSSTPTVEPTAVPNTPTPQALAILVTPASAEVVQPAAEESPDPASDPPSSGGCNASLSQVSIATGLANFLLMFAPVGLTMAVRRRNRS